MPRIYPKNKKRWQANYNRITEKFKNGDIIIDIDERRAVVLYVTEHDIKTTGIQVSYPGLYAFYGFWYGYNAFDIYAYGKIQLISENDIVIANFNDYKNNQLTPHEWNTIVDGIKIKDE